MGCGLGCGHGVASTSNHNSSSHDVYLTAIYFPRHALTQKVVRMNDLKKCKNTPGEKQLCILQSIHPERKQTHACVHGYARAHMHMGPHIHTQRQAHTHTHTHTHAHTHTHTHTHARTHIHMHTCTNTHTPTHTHTNRNTNTHTAYR